MFQRYKNVGSDSLREKWLKEYDKEREDVSSYTQKIKCNVQL